MLSSQTGPLHTSQDLQELIDLLNEFKETKATTDKILLLADKLISFQSSIKDCVAMSDEEKKMLFSTGWFNFIKISPEEKKFNKERCKLLFILSKHLPDAKQNEISLFYMLVKTNHYHPIRKESFAYFLETIPYWNNFYYIQKICHKADIDFIICFLHLRLLQKAVAENNLEQVQVLLKQPHLPIKCDENFIGHLVIYRGYLSILRDLINDTRFNFIADEWIISAAAKGHLEILKLLMHAGAQVHAQENLPLITAAENGHLIIVNFLLLQKNVEPAAQENEAICRAVANGHLPVIKRLLLEKKVKTTIRKNALFRLACQSGHIETIQFFITQPRVDPSRHKNLVLRRACLSGNAELVELLLRHEKIDPTKSYALHLPIEIAKKYNHINVMAVLFRDERVRKQTPYFSPSSRLRIYPMDLITRCYFKPFLNFSIFKNKNNKGFCDKKEPIKIPLDVVYKIGFTLFKTLKLPPSFLIKHTESFLYGNTQRKK